MTAGTPSVHIANELGGARTFETSHIHLDFCYSSSVPCPRVALASLLVTSCALVACPAPSSSGEGEGEGGVGEGEGAAAGEGEGASTQEHEPNNGATADEVNALRAGDVVDGAIDPAGDIDIFQVATTPGDVYRATLTAPAGSSIDGHLTILDAGRGGKAAGNDYVRLERAPDGAGAQVSFVAFGVGGDLVAVRDARDVDGTPTGGASATYALTVVDEGPATSAAAPIAFPATVEDALDDVGSVKLYSFTANANADFTIHVQAHGDLDARLFLYSVEQGDWIARNDDQAVNDKDPLLDAFFPVGGAMVIVVESAAESASVLTYTLSTTGNAP